MTGGLNMNIKKLMEIINDISEDMEESEERRGPSGMYVVLFPQVICWVLGFAFAHLFSLGTLGYVILGYIFSITIGTYKNVEYDKIAFKYAVIRNLLMSFIFFFGIIFGMLFGAMKSGRI
jgi:hypothetical protein